MSYSKYVFLGDVIRQGRVLFVWQSISRFNGTYRLGEDWAAAGTGRPRVPPGLPWRTRSTNLAASCLWWRSHVTHISVGISSSHAPTLSKYRAQQSGRKRKVTSQSRTCVASLEPFARQPPTTTVRRQGRTGQRSTEGDISIRVFCWTRGCRAGRMVEGVSQRWLLQRIPGREDGKNHTVLWCPASNDAAQRLGANRFAPPLTRCPGRSVARATPGARGGDMAYRSTF